MSAMIHDDVSSRRSSEPWFDPENGVGWRQVKSHGTLVAKTPYWLTWDETGPLSMAMPTLDLARGYVIFPWQAAAADDVLKFQFAGYISNMVTPSLSVAAGHSLDLDTSGVIADGGADPTGGPHEFAANVDATTTAVLHNAWLFGEMVTVPA